MKYIGFKGCGKDYIGTVKMVRKICFYWFGIGFYFTTLKIRSALIDTVLDFINNGFFDKD